MLLGGQPVVLGGGAGRRGQATFFGVGGRAGAGMGDIEEWTAVRPAEGETGDRSGEGERGGDRDRDGGSRQ
jgi:hypothetical protein